MAPRTKPRLVSTALVADPTTGAAPEAFIQELPKSVADEVEAAKTAQVSGLRHVYRGEQASRLSVDVPPGLHKALRLRCVAEEISVRDFVIRALADAGIVEP